MKLTPIQIALLAMAHDTRARGPREVVAVWGSWQKAALTISGALISLGTDRSTRELEWKTLHGRHRRGRAGRVVHVYQLAEEPFARLAARCAWAVANKPADRSHVTWKDVPAEVPTPRPGKRCAGCGCVPGKPCTFELPDGHGDGECVPAGVLGFRRCTGCQLREAA